MRNVTISVIQLENKLFDKNANLLKAGRTHPSGRGKGRKNEYACPNFLSRATTSTPSATGYMSLAKG